ncbi:carboxylesterase [Halorhodospira abdelmalekii]|uniref:alpha/beta hydrolase n=1 Tax=Halorhodospira abdelmalekii TaxID=421629 RepID=UPI001906CB0A|nr:alpha/beta fold hydrolase [Halorhodospira abdelmalekii]MBK1733743.1 carboxylesterase [Halorhodospira abdelmalekii]
MSEQPLEHIERTSATGAVTASVIWLHGLGADGSDFVPIVDQLPKVREIGVRFIFPHAPVQPVTVNGGMAMRAWYDILGLGAGIEEDAAGVAAAYSHVQRLLAHEQARGVAPERIVLAGFSQGGATALYSALQEQQPLAGVIALSGWLPQAAQITPAESVSLPILLAHGAHDPIVPIELGRSARSRLEEAGYPVEWHEYPMEHAVCMPEIEQVDDWLARRLTSTHLA